MATDLKLFGGRFEPQKGALKKDPSLPVYATFIRTKNKSIAKTLLHAEFLKFAPDYADDYFAPKVWEAVEGMFCTTEGQFYTDIFTDDIVWNAEKGEPERVLVEPELTDDSEQGQTEEKMTAVKPLPANYRAASLVLFGPVPEITAIQYGQVMDLVNDDESSFARELAEAIARETRVLELLPERQEELLAHLRETVKETAQWPDFKRPINKWLDTPPAQREQSNKAGGDKLTIDDHKQRSVQLRYRIACGVISRSMDFDVLNPPIGIEVRANSILSDKNDTVVTDWFVVFSRTPGVYDFSPAAIVAIIKTAEDKISHYPGELRKYIDKCVADFDCINPPQLVIDIACGRTSSPLPQKNDAEQTLQDENLPPAVDPVRAAELDRELEAAFADSTPAEGDELKPSNDEELRHKTSLMLAQQRGECIPELGDNPADPKWDSMAFSASNEGEKTEVAEREDDRLPMDAREIEIAHALNDLLSGRTDIMGKEEAEGVVVCTGHIIADVLPLLVIDIATTEFCLSPNFSDEDIHDVATTILDGWSDDAAVRQKIALDAIVEYRRPELPKAVVIDPPVLSLKPKREPDPTPALFAETTTLSYRQQLTIAALQGICSNPAYRGDFDELALMAVQLATDVISAEAEL
ncbi:hypothetical protein [Citrobacter cronae]|uniref:hypothetical protein n=1 Tax=Citrobacter cronae TaxID=1748967 RepID=UPI0021CF02B7|nr:hypothetical protein [Citrobacter cronae]